MSLLAALLLVLSGPWYFRMVGEEAWLPATVPGTVHTDLMAVGRIADPFVANNEDSVRWVELQDWEYTTRFTVSRREARLRHHRLCFDGLDTYADVYLDGQLVLQADNMHRRWVLDVPMSAGEHQLRLLFHSPIRHDEGRWDALPFPYEASNDYSELGGQGCRKLSVVARKAGYHYGWDWGPRIVTSGIWRPVHLEHWDECRIQDVYYEQVEVNETCAQLIAHLTLQADSPQQGVSVRIALDDSLYSTHHINIREGEHQYAIPLTVRQPQLWWCNGEGNPYRYHASLSVAGLVDEQRIGLRSLRLVQEPDSIGRSFYFALNGRPVFAYGANHIPMDVFLPRVSTAKYQHILSLAAQSGMNMLRVWGGGVYEDDRFYDLCDSLGLMVWQDFMFACAMYPFEGELEDNVVAEAVDNICRLRRHPCIALWCGNNECQDAWMGWGWSRKARRQDPAMADRIWAQYLHQYHEVLPSLVHQYCNVDYVPSSPYSTVDARANEVEGDCHYWEPWQGVVPLEEYERKQARFFSEYGFESYPCRQTLLTVCPDSSQWYLGSAVMAAHQRATNGDENLVRSLRSAGFVWNDFDEFILATQCLQARLMQRTVDAHRQAAPRTMGSLIWQLTDCWPGASWSLIDYYGRVKFLPHIDTPIATPNTE